MRITRAYFYFYRVELHLSPWIAVTYSEILPLSLYECWKHCLESYRNILSFNLCWSKADQMIKTNNFIGITLLILSLFCLKATVFVNLTLKSDDHKISEKQLNCFNMKIKRRWDSINTLYPSPPQMEIWKFHFS